MVEGRDGHLVEDNGGSGGGWRWTRQKTAADAEEDGGGRGENGKRDAAEAAPVTEPEVTSRSERWIVLSGSNAAVCLHISLSEDEGAERD